MYSYCKMPDYKNGKVYALELYGVRFYIGSSTRTLAKRKSHHKSTSKSKPHIMVYRYVEEHGNWDDVQIVLIEDYPCDTYLQLCEREAYYINLYKPVGNQLIPANGSGREWMLKNRDRWNAYQREWARQNRRNKKLALIAEPPPSNTPPQDALQD
jgi:hypothetical protein